MVHRGPSPGPFVLFPDRIFLTRDCFVTAVQETLDLAGLDAVLYAGHSFNIGMVTMAAQCGLLDSLIKTLGQWQSAAYTVYIWTP